MLEHTWHITLYITDEELAAMKDPFELSRKAALVIQDKYDAAIAKHLGIDTPFEAELKKIDEELNNG